eukprot:5590033-Alexandrium_andersonii.AAC.1
MSPPPSHDRRWGDAQQHPAAKAATSVSKPAHAVDFSAGAAHSPAAQPTSEHEPTREHIWASANLRAGTSASAFAALQQNSSIWATST